MAVLGYDTLIYSTFYPLPSTLTFRVIAYSEYGQKDGDRPTDIRVSPLPVLSSTRMLVLPHTRKPSTSMYCTYTLWVGESSPDLRGALRRTKKVWYRQCGACEWLAGNVRWGGGCIKWIERGGGSYVCMYVCMYSRRRIRCRGISS